MICRGRSTLIYCRAFNKYIVIYFCTRAYHFSSWNLRSAKFTATSNLALYFVINDIYDTLMNARSIVHICFTSRLINTRHRCGVSVFRGRWIGLWGGFSLSVQSEHYARNHLASRRRKSRRGIFINNPERAVHGEVSPRRRNIAINHRLAFQSRSCFINEGG